MPISYEQLDALWQVAGWTMVHFLWVGTVGLVLAALVRMTVRRARPNVRYAAMLGCFALIAATPIGIAVLVSTEGMSNVEQGMSNAEGREEVATDALATPLQPITPFSHNVLTTPPEPITPFSRHATSVRAAATKPQPGRVGILAHLVPFLPVLWLTGAPLTLLWLAAGLVGTKRLRLASRPTEAGPLAEALHRAKQTLRISGTVGLAVCDRLAAPVLVGIVRPLILLPPAALTGWSPEELEMVLLHELAHVRRWDNLVNLVQRLVEAILFFHPAVWIVSSWIRGEREHCCDAAVLRYTKSAPREYARTLVAIAEAAGASRRVAALGSHTAVGRLKQRIQHILKTEDEPMRVSMKTMMAAVAAVALVCGATWYGLAKAEEGMSKDEVGDTYTNSKRVQKYANARTLKEATEICRAELINTGNPEYAELLSDKRVLDAIKTATKAYESWLDAGVQSDDPLAVARMKGYRTNFKPVFDDIQNKGIWLKGCYFDPIPGLTDSYGNSFDGLLLRLNFDLPNTPHGVVSGFALPIIDLLYGRSRLTKQNASDNRPEQPDRIAVGKPNGSAREDLRYDNKTFDEWRTEWRTELKTERRIEAIRALAAFGARGYGKEAAETVLEVVKEYDFTSIDGTQVGNLKNAAIQAFNGRESAGGDGPSQIPIADWLPALVRNIRAGDKRAATFSMYVFRGLSGAHKGAVPQLIELSRDPSFEDMQGPILRGLSKIYRETKDERIAQRMTEVLKSEDASLARIAFDALVPNPGQLLGGVDLFGADERAEKAYFKYTPTLLDALAHKDNEIQRRASLAFINLAPQEKALAIPPLIEMLGHENEEVMRSAINLLGSFGPDARAATDALLEIAKDKQNPNRDHAIYALMQIDQPVLPQLDTE